MAACFRYIVNDVSAAIDFYTKHLGFKVEMHPAPGFAEISRGDMHIYLTQASQGGVGGGAPMPSGEQQKPEAGTASTSSSTGWMERLPRSNRPAVAFAAT
jgi:catechol 2,3-dioxygenase-like lactoylglutathione lyase family enzyme